jgi:2-dehydro-3-deoxyphosphogluconate aldolase/(4S)-4-hydroxy-2-oxoglutarate aldolase
VSARALQARPGRFHERLAALRVLPIVEVSSPERAVELAVALEEAGLPLLEVTLRTPAAAAAIRAVRSSCPHVLVGAGTIIDSSDLEAAVEAGAAFGVSPGFDSRLAGGAREAGLAYVPGVATATEVQAALASGHRTLKFFPAEATGGAAALQALGAAFGGARVSFIPTGGIHQASAPRYLALEQVLAVGGTWIAPCHDIEAGAWAAIGARARAARQLADVA